jgi:hypothetical protein
MATKNKNQHARFYGLLAKMNGADKDDIVWQYSDMLTTSLSEFLSKKPQKYARMIVDLQQIVDSCPKNDTEKEKLVKDRELKKRRSAILVRLQRYGIDTTNWTEVNRFMRQPKIAGKTLGEMSIEEMNRLISKLESILTKTRAKTEQLNILAKNN